MMPRPLLLLAPVMLAACGGSDDGPGTGGVSVEEAEALDQAAGMLDSQRLPPEALDEAGDQPGTDLAPGGAESAVQ